MSKRVLAILVAILMAVGIYSAVASAGVEGEFTFDIYMWPQGVQSEVTKFDLDFESSLDLNITLSGLTFSNNLVMGIAGLEYYIGNIETTLGALELKDELVFARPYIGLPYPYIGPSKWWSYWTGWPVPEPYPIGTMLFVKKRAYGEITIGGLTFSTLAMFEDVNFPHPRASKTMSTSKSVWVPGKELVAGIFAPFKAYVYWTEKKDFMPVHPTTGKTICDYVKDGKITTGQFTASYVYGSGLVSVTKVECIPGNPGKLRVTVEGTPTTVKTTDPRKGYVKIQVTWSPPAEMSGHYYGTLYGVQTQSFRAGVIFGIEGTTVSGITVTAKTGICADWRIRPAYYFFMGGKHYTSKQLEYAENVIKKKAWTESVCTNPKLEFTKEYLAIEGITLADVLTLDVYSIVSLVPLNIFTAIQSTVNLFDIATLYLWMDLITPKDLLIEPTYDPTTGEYRGPGGNPIVILSVGEWLDIVWLDVNRDLTVSSGVVPALADTIIFDHVMTLQNVTFRNYLTAKVGFGLDYMHNEVEIPISFPEEIGTFTIDAEWYDADYDGNVEFEDIDFGIVKTYGEHNEFGINAAFNEDGMYGANIWVTVNFSL